MLLKRKKPPQLWWAEEAFGNPVLLVQFSGSPPQRAHTTTNRTQTSEGRSDTTDREATASKRCDNTKRIQRVSTFGRRNQPFLLDQKAVSAYN